jgi:hypothetical protein
MNAGFINREKLFLWLRILTIWIYHMFAMKQPRLPSETLLAVQGIIIGHYQRIKPQIQCLLL